MKVELRYRPWEPMSLPRGKGQGCAKVLPLEVALEGGAGGIWQMEGKRRLRPAGDGTSQELAGTKAKGHETAVRNDKPIG